jgi:hypothetical protein
MSVPNSTNLILFLIYCLWMPMNSTEWEKRSRNLARDIKKKPFDPSYECWQMWNRRRALQSNKICRLYYSWNEITLVIISDRKNFYHLTAWIMTCPRYYLRTRKTLNKGKEGENNNVGFNSHYWGLIYKDYFCNACIQLRIWYVIDT